ncbi:unnamed protein product [Fusarium graminearum]|nr:unnamed protein product [Fusarium graminearum]
MDYRGSKSTVRVRKLYTVVKEQRVDGHRCINLMHLRYALMGFERNYQIRILSKQLIMPSLRRSYTSLSVNPNLKSTATGTLNPLFLTGFSDAESNFTVRIFKNLNVLEKISSFLGVGKIYHKEESSIYMVQSLRDIDVIINHFEKYPLLTKKLEDFQLASMNKGLSTFMKTTFPDIIPATRPSRSDEELINSKIDPY